MYVEVSCGPHYFSSTTVPVVEGRCKWYEEIKTTMGNVYV